MNQTIIVSTHIDFMGDLPLMDVHRYMKFARAYLAEIGYTDVEFDNNLNTYNCKTPFSMGSDEYQEIEDTLDSAWARAVS